MLNFSKKGFAVSGAVIGVAFFTIVSLILVLQILVSTGKARRLILKEINKTLPVNLSVEKYHLSLVTGLIDLSTIRIEGRDNVPILLIDHLQATIGFLPLLRGEVAFDTLLIENPIVWFRPDHEATLNLLNEFSGPDNGGTTTPSADFPVNIRIRKATLTGGDFHYVQVAPSETLDIEDISLTLIDGDLLEESCTVNLDSGKIVINGPEIKTVFNELKLEGTLNSGDLNLVSLGIRADNHHLDISGRVSDVFTFPAIDLRADLVSQLDALGADADLSGTLTTHMEVKGSGVSAETFTIKSRIETASSDFSVDGVLSPSNVTLSADVGYQNQRMALNRFDLKIEAVHLVATGDYDPTTDEINSSLTLEAPDLADIQWVPGIGPFGGFMGLTAEISGKLKMPRIDTQLQGRDVSIQGTKTGNIDAVLKFENGRMTIEKCGLTKGKSMMAVSGAIDIMDPETGTVYADPALAFTLAESFLYPEDFFEKTKGDIAITGRVEGSMKNPQGLVSLTGKKMDTGFQTVEDLKLSVSFDRNKINLDNCIIAFTPGQQIKVTGLVRPVEKDYDLHLVSNEIGLNSIDYLRNLTGISGKFILDMVGKGSFKNPVFEGSIAVKDLNPEGEVNDDINIDLALRNNDLSVSGDLGFNLEAFYNIDSMDFKAEAGFSKTKLLPLFELLGHPDISGFVTGGIQVKGNAGSPEQITALADITGCSIHHNGTELIQAEAFYATLKDKVLMVPGIHLNFQNTGSFKLSGNGELDGDIDFSITGTIPAETAQIFTVDYQEINGSIELAGSLKGTVETPRIEGQINLIDIGVTVPELMQRLHDINGKITMTPQAVSVEAVRGRVEAGEFRLSGNLTHENLIPTYLEAEFSSTALPVNLPDSMELLLNTKLSVRGTPDDSMIEGSILILEGRYYKDVSLNFLTNIGKKTRQYQPVKKVIDLPFLNDPELKISIQNRTPLEIENNIAVMTLHPDLSLYGTVNRPLISGRASVPSGILIYQDNDFEITKGVVDFINPYKIEPEIDISGQAEVRDWTIYLEVSGKPDNLEFELTSDPAEEHWNILSLLTFGKTGKELTGSETGDESISAKQQIADMLARSLQEKIQSETSFDSIEMEYSENTEQDTSDDIKVTVGKELAERLTVKYGVETRSGVTVQSAESEYQLLESLLMKTFHDTAGDFGGELVFRLEFR